jgi:hypothetical protein
MGGRAHISIVTVNVQAKNALEIGMNRKAAAIAAAFLFA